MKKFPYHGDLRMYSKESHYNYYYEFVQEFLLPDMDIDDLLWEAHFLTDDSPITEYERSKCLATADYLLTLLNNYSLDSQKRIIEYSLYLYERSKGYAIEVPIEELIPNDKVIYLKK